MAGRIRNEDVKAVREAALIDEVVGDHVALRRAGAGSLKGLCPFHDEKTPSFTVRTQLGLYHCFGCGAGGDVIDFVQQQDHVSFAEAVQILASRYNITLRYEDGDGPSAESISARKRVLDINAAAAQLFTQQLLTPEAAMAREFLQQRGFDREAADLFGIGYAPKGWDFLRKALLQFGYSEEEQLLAGVLSPGTGRGPFDRFRGRLIWPIRDITGAVIGFGARKLYDDDQGPKYLNTPETPVYHKSSVLFGLDLAKKAIAQNAQVVVVEGYTDVMACHLSGVVNVVATCGTAFAADHAKMLRRMLSTDDVVRGEVIFTFDGDAAGQKAALKTFDIQHQLSANSYVAVAESGMDPCDLRLKRGPQAILDLLANKTPLFEFVLVQRLRHWDTATVEGRVGALGDVAPVLASISHPGVQKEYVKRVSGWLALDVTDVISAMRSAPRRHDGVDRSREPASVTAGHVAPGADPGVPPGLSGQRSSGRRPQRGPASGDVTAERMLLAALLQVPAWVPEQLTGYIEADSFTVSAHQQVYDAVVAAGWPHQVSDGVAWVQQVREHVPVALQQFVIGLGVADLPASGGEAGLQQLAAGLASSMAARVLQRRMATARGQLARESDLMTPADREALQRYLQHLELTWHALRAN